MSTDDRPLFDTLVSPNAGDEGDVLAGRFTRFCAVFVDGILIWVVMGPLMYLTGYFDVLAGGAQPTPALQLVMSLAGIVSYLAVHGWLLAKKGQTIGKKLAGIQIVDYQTGRLLPMRRVYVYRYLWYLPLTLLCIFIPGTTDDQLINVVYFIDAVLIFGSERRCLHDYIAGSKVVKYEEGRPHLEATRTEDRFAIEG